MKKLTYISCFLILFNSLLWSLNYSNNYAESDFYVGKYDKIVRFDEIYFHNQSVNFRESKELKLIVKKIKKELSNPHAKVRISLVGYSEHRATKEEALEASKHYVEDIYKVLTENNIDKNMIYKYFEADNVMLYSDETKKSNALSNRVNINMYVNYVTDHDHDGVYSDKDKCPNSKEGAIVGPDGCSAKEIVVLVKGHKKKSKIIVSNKAGSVVIDHFNEYTLIGSNTTAPLPPEKISQQKIDKSFSKLIGIDVINKHYIFYFDNINILDNSKKELNDMLLEIAKIKNPIIKIIGHTDTVGTAQYNKKLGFDRAKEIEKLILKSKIKVLKIDVLSYGEKNLAVKTADNVDKKQNRRVEVFIH